ncbi:hypothetical protein ACFVTC_18450 [Streptomyces sp. NPDC057950]|uniref:hypothetical protein n=1 Tax=Streptomyces sp. NPDC057950 TaxID=3346288 RepID=UPI0036EEFEE0
MSQEAAAKENLSAPTYPIAFPLEPSPAGTIAVLLMPDPAPLSDAEKAELRVARAALAASRTPERGASDLLEAAGEASVSTITTLLLTAGGSALRARWNRRRSHTPSPPDWDFDQAWAKVKASSAAVSPPDAPTPRLLTASENAETHEWRIECRIGDRHYVARVDETSAVVLWEPHSTAEADRSA